jgi:hypothetical protein
MEPSYSVCKVFEKSEENPAYCAICGWPRAAHPYPTGYICPSCSEPMDVTKRLAEVEVQEDNSADIKSFMVTELMCPNGHPWYSEAL